MADLTMGHVHSLASGGHDAAHRDRRGAARMLGSLAGAAGVVLLVPLVVLLIGLPIALAIRALVELAARLGLPVG